MQLHREAQRSEPAYDPGLYGGALPCGWYLVLGDGWDYRDLVEEQHAAALSRAGGDTLYFCTDDGSMCTRLACYESGKAVWSITYDGADGVSEPQVEGVPPGLAELLAELQERQRRAGGSAAEVDHLYELTAEVGRRLLDFRHDETLGNGQVLPIDVLAPA
jgi:hypothetical protein